MKKIIYRKSIDEIKKELDKELGINNTSKIGINSFIKRINRDEQININCFKKI